VYNPVHRGIIDGGVIPALSYIDGNGVDRHSLLEGVAVDGRGKGSEIKDGWSLLKQIVHGLALESNGRIHPSISCRRDKGHEQTV
jgi:hypothetical protein